MDDSEQEDFILFYGWWTNEIKFNRENFQCYAQNFSCSFKHYSSKLSQRKPILTGLYNSSEFYVDLNSGAILEKDCLDSLKGSRLTNAIVPKIYHIVKLSDENSHRSKLP